MDRNISDVFLIHYANVRSYVFGIFAEAVVAAQSVARGVGRETFVDDQFGRLCAIVSPNGDVETFGAPMPYNDMADA